MKREWSTVNLFVSRRLRRLKMSSSNKFSLPTPRFFVFFAVLKRLPKKMFELNSAVRDMGNFLGFAKDAMNSQRTQRITKSND